MQGYKHPISVARKVMDNLPHVFLVGRGGERFAAEMGFERCNLLTKEARQVWEERLRADMSKEALNHLAERFDLWKWVEIATDPERAKGTVNLLARDAQGNICAGASTSGWAWKYPGRLGDSPVCGALSQDGPVVGAGWPAGNGGFERPGRSLPQPYELYRHGPGWALCRL